MKRILIPLFVLTMLTQSSLFAASYYLYYEPGCMSRLEYRYPETQSGQEYIVYQISVGGSEKLLLETGIESLGGIWRTLPGPVIYCNAPERSAFNSAMANAITQKIHQVFIVLPIGSGQYRVTQVKKASVFSNERDFLKIEADDYRVSYPKNGSARNSDLSNNHPRGRVYFSQTISYGNCPAYVFRRNGLTANNYLDIIVVPELGVVEERNSNGSTYKLKSINSTDAPMALNALCAGTEVQNQDKFASRGIPSVYDNNSTLKVPGNQATPPRRSHTVQSKESLYGISRRYQLKITDLMRWNNLQENSIIQPGMALFIEGPADLPTDNPIVQTFDTRDGSRKKEEANAWLGAPEIYSVQQGETVASIAKKMGYTEARFRYFNNLSENYVLSPGDKVRTSDCMPLSAPGQPAQDKFSPFFQDPLTDDLSKTPQGNAPTFMDKGASTPQPKTMMYDDQDFYYGPVPGQYYPPAQPTKAPESFNYNNPAPAYYQPYGSKGSEVPATFEWNSKSPTTTTTRGGAPAVRQKHIVRDGETLWSIARKYGLTEAQLRALNNLGPGETILEFQTIFVN